jgi:transcriptional regulator with XRE-family HTH domain
MHSTRSVGELLREWRERRRLTQIELAAPAEISTRHLSFVETGRAQPSRDMLLCLAEKLDIPLRERNALLRSQHISGTCKDGMRSYRHADSIRLNN